MRERFDRPQFTKTRMRAKKSTTMLSEKFITAFSELNDAAYAITHTQLADASTAVARLEKARREFHELFWDVVREEGKTAPGAAKPS